jgi:branched-chain amino acid transport system ATP-binding protein
MSLTANNIIAGYGKIQVLSNVSLKLEPGQVHCVFGPNGSGKSTFLKVCAGALKPTSGTLESNGLNLLGLRGHEFIRAGIVTVPQSGGVFADLSVLENLQAGGLSVEDKAAVKTQIERMFEKFPILREKKNARAGALSGGQRMLLAFARALVSRPKVLLLDEPSAGLAPIVVKEVFALIRELRAQGPAILLVEQAVRDALPLADQVTVLAQGEVQYSGPASGIDEAGLARAYLGLSTA